MTNYLYTMQTHNKQKKKHAKVLPIKTFEIFFMLDEIFFCQSSF